MSTPHGERVMKVNSLDSRARRRMVGQLMTAQEAADKAQEALEDLMIALYDKGLPYSVIGGALGMHPTSAQQRIDKARARQAEEKS